MILGHGIIDYIVVILCVVFSAYLLLTRPRELLVFLPTMVTIDFFIPFISHLTPGRLVPLVIVVWWIYAGKSPFRPPLGIWLKAAFAITLASTIGAVVMQDSGLRPLIRSVNYINLAVLCSFAWQFGASKLGNLRLYQGFALAGLIHGGHSLYQLVAVRMDLPFRGIVYSAGKAGASLAGNEIGGFRINGFADEPKRLGLILIAGTIALLFLGSRQTDPVRKYLMLGSALVILLLSFLTYSASYLGALAIFLPLVLLISRRGWKYVGWLAALAAVLGFFAAGTVKQFIVTQQAEIESREREMEMGLDATTVYRQELFAEDYLKNNPATALIGVGMGRYYEVFNKEYGTAAGMGMYGDLLPLNSQFFELMYDTGLPGLVLLYAGSLLVFWKVHRLGVRGYLLGAIVLFQIIQSFFVQSLPLLVLAVGGGMALIHITEKSARRTSNPRKKTQHPIAANPHATMAHPGPN